MANISFNSDKELSKESILSLKPLLESSLISTLQLGHTITLPTSESLNEMLELHSGQAESKVSSLNKELKSKDIKAPPFNSNGMIFHRIIISERNYKK
ncbi:hypothetical protein [Clostridium sp. CCUG 7971]|uniref:hypothetical protein n=1 Tax=Clostridium sp. CCUG 7971 TaxID=2811414 RepID=UPI001ABA09A8|nr:hypothetical protein [Clostridium sp. CCUG 7971]MBO3444142.1 hypothetical protein [Clostridium sp. CCUG 7971]